MALISGSFKSFETFVKNGAWDSSYMKPPVPVKLEKPDPRPLGVNVHWTDARPAVSTIKGTPDNPVGLDDMPRLMAKLQEKPGSWSNHAAWIDGQYGLQKNDGLRSISVQNPNGLQQLKLQTLRKLGDMNHSGKQALTYSDALKHALPGFPDSKTGNHTISISFNNEHTLNKWVEMGITLTPDAARALEAHLIPSAVEAIRAITSHGWNDEIIRNIGGQDSYYTLGGRELESYRASLRR